MSNKKLNQETVLVAKSDEHLTAAKEAERTGEAFESKGSEDLPVVPLEVVTEFAETQGKVGVFGMVTVAAERTANQAKVVEESLLSNEEKAQQHAEYSAELVRAQQREDNEIRDKIRKGFDMSLAVQEANLATAQKYEGYSTEFELVRRESVSTPILNTVEETVKVVDNGGISTGSTIGTLGTRSPNLTSPTVLSQEMTKLLDTTLSDTTPPVEFVSNDMQEELGKTDAGADVGETSLTKNHPGVAFLASARSSKDLGERLINKQTKANKE